MKKIFIFIIASFGFFSSFNSSAADKTVFQAMAEGAFYNNIKGNNQPLVELVIKEGTLSFEVYYNGFLRAIASDNREILSLF